MAPDDLQAGQLVTVLQWYEEEEEQPSFGDPLAFLRRSPSKRRTDGLGMVYRIVAVDLPYVAAQDYRGTVCILDARRLELKRVSQRYAQAVLRSLEDQLRKKTSQESGLASLLGMGDDDS